MLQRHVGGVARQEWALQCKLQVRVTVNAWHLVGTATTRKTLIEGANVMNTWLKATVQLSF